MNPYKEAAARLIIAVENLKAGAWLLEYLDARDHDEFMQWHSGLSMQVEAWKQKHRHQLQTGKFVELRKNGSARCAKRLRASAPGRARSPNAPAGKRH